MAALDDFLEAGPMSPVLYDAFKKNKRPENDGGYLPANMFMTRLHDLADLLPAREDPYVRA